MACSVELLRKAEKFLRKAPQDAVERIEGRLGELAENPICDEKLEPPLDKLCKTRVGHYRIAYKLEPCKIIVVHIGQRRSFYDELNDIMASLTFFHHVFHMFY